MKKSSGRCLLITLIIRCDGKLQKVQQKYNHKYYLGYRCSKCGHIVHSFSHDPRSSPWKNVPEVNDASSKVMKGLEKLHRQQ